MNTNENNTTICALATHPGVAGIAVIRVSGDRCFDIVNSLFVGSRRASYETANHILIGKWVHDNVFLDEVTLSVFAAPKSYTGEDVCEIGCHGGSVVPESIIDSLVASGCRIATAGEFTQRAFLNGKIDLSKADAIADLIHSENPRGVAVARKQYNSKFQQQVQHLRDRLFEVAGLLELELDFSEEDVEFVSRESLSSLLTELKDFTSSLISNERSSRLLRSGITVGLFGYPNAGKSSLFNALVDRERAIVSDVAGTTRDFIEVSVMVEGVKVTFVDTAGVRDSEDSIELAGIALARNVVRNCDIVCIVNDISQGEQYSQDLSESIRQRLTSDQTMVTIHNKCDLVNVDITTSEIEDTGVYVSTVTSDGISTLTSFIRSYILSNTSTSNTVLVNARIMGEISIVDEILDSLLSAETLEHSELIASDLRTCVRHLNYITGDEWNENILNSVFKNFCIGK